MRKNHMSILSISGDDQLVIFCVYRFEMSGFSKDGYI